MKKKILNRNNRVTSILVIILMVFLALSCNNMIDLGQGSLAVALPGGRSADGHLYTIEVASPTGATQTRTARGGQVVQFDGLSPNSYTVTVTGSELSDDDEVGTVVLYGSNSATVVARQSASVAIDLINVVSTSTALGGAIEKGGTIYVYGQIDLSAELGISNDVTIKAAHKNVTISATTGISLFTVNGGNLTLGDGEHTLILDGNNLASTTGISVGTGGQVTLKSNAIIQNCKQHGVSVGAGTFTLDGGTIKNNDGDQGAGVYTSGKFVMISGSIKNNSSKTSGSLDGGGVYINGGNGGSFEMNGGSITGNTASGNGGGVYINGKNDGTFEMNGGSISGNTASGNGGGVYINEESGGSFEMNRGSITGNTASLYGGGVYVNGGTFTYTAGTISGNTTTESSYDVFLTNNGFIVGTLPADTKRNKIIN